MKWIALAILLFIALYTFLNLRYRKPGPGFLPYEDARQRMGLAHAGYQRITAKIDRPADPQPLLSEAAMLPAPGGLPADLLSTLIVPPLLPAEIGAVEATAVASAAAPYRIAFSCTLGDNHQDLAAVHLYIKGGDIFVVPDCDRLLEGLVARARADVVVLTVPPGALPAGFYRMTLAGERAAKFWTLQVH